MTKTASTVTGTFPRGFSEEQPPVWPMVRADSIVELRYGRALTESTRREGQIPVYGTNGRTGWHDEALASGPGVILGRKGMGNLGVEWSPSDFWVIDTAYYAQAQTEQLDLQYFYYLISYIGLNHLKDGTSNPSLSRDTFGAQLLPFPPKDSQTAIAATLSELDDKIEQNRRTGRALERLARATFNAWFVDFEPVKAKAAGQTSFPGLPPAAFAALPDRLTDSPLGRIPQGWEVKPLSAICQIVSGGTPKRSEAAYWGGDIPWYSVKDAPPDGMPWVHFTDEQITQAGLHGSAATMVTVGCTIISARGTVGRLALVARPMAFNQSCYGLLPSDGASYRHLYLLLRQVVGELQQRTHGSVFDTITRQTFDGVEVVHPPSALLEKFEQVVAPLFELLLASLKESHMLAELRDYLLPRLLSGTVRAEVRRG